MKINFNQLSRIGEIAQKARVYALNANCIGFIGKCILSPLQHPHNCHSNRRKTGWEKNLEYQNEIRSKEKHTKLIIFCIIFIGDLVVNNLLVFTFIWGPYLVI